MKKAICVFAILFTFCLINGQKLINSDWSESMAYNPSDNILYVELCSGLTYLISDLLGKKVLTGKITNSLANVDINSLSNGTYLFQVGILNKYEKLKRQAFKLKIIKD